MPEKRRFDDGFVFKVAKLWPIILSLAALVYTAASTQNKVQNENDQIKNHEFRITRLENDLSKVRENTDLLVDRLIRKSH